MRTPSERDDRIRLAAFEFLKQATELRGDVLPRELLLRGFVFEDDRVALMSRQGIFKPRILTDAPLSITTVPEIPGKERPYDDRIEPEGRIVYRYRGTDPGHRDNRGLREAMRHQRPLVYLKGMVPGRYMPVWPVFIVGDDPSTLAFRVQFEDAAKLLPGAVEEASDPGREVRRAYVTIETVKRLHQRSFRERVVLAYRRECAMCQLRHEELLDAAHILPDGHPKGAPVVPNGLALCKLHHAAFDENIIGVRPDYVLMVRGDVLKEIDGPMLEHGLQDLHEVPLVLPRSRSLRPNPEFLAERYEEFRRSA